MAVDTTKTHDSNGTAEFSDEAMNELVRSIDVVDVRTQNIPDGFSPFSAPVVTWDSSNYSAWFERSSGDYFLNAYASGIGYPTNIAGLKHINRGDYAFQIIFNGSGAWSRTMTPTSAGTWKALA